jgi:hypothetical protein
MNGKRIYQISAHKVPLEQPIGYTIEMMKKLVSDGCLAPNDQYHGEKKLTDHPSGVPEINPRF